MFQSFKKMTKNIIPFLVVMTTLTIESKEINEIHIATNYYDAIYNGDYDAARSVASADLIFKDPTAPAEYGIPNQINNLDNFLELFTRANESKLH